MTVAETIQKLENLKFDGNLYYLEGASVLRFGMIKDKPTIKKRLIDRLTKNRDNFPVIPLSDNFNIDEYLDTLQIVGDLVGVNVRKVYEAY